MHIINVMRSSEMSHLSYLELGQVTLPNLGLALGFEYLLGLVLSEDLS